MDSEQGQPSLDALNHRFDDTMVRARAAVYALDRAVDRLGGAGGSAASRRADDARSRQHVLADLTADLGG